MTERHFTTLRHERKRTRYGTQTSWYARCACGWKGPGHRKPSLAVEDGFKHARKENASA